MLDVFFQKIRSCVSFTKREFLYSKISVIFNSFDSILSVEVYSSIPSSEMSCLSGASPLIRPRRSIPMHRCALNQKFISGGDVPSTCGICQLSNISLNVTLITCNAQALDEYLCLGLANKWNSKLHFDYQFHIKMVLY
jgi:hypothetical protein